MTDQEKIELLREKLIFAQGVIGNLQSYVERYTPTEDELEGWKYSRRSGLLSIGIIEDALRATEMNNKIMVYVDKAPKTLTSRGQWSTDQGDTISGMVMEVKQTLRSKYPTKHLVFTHTPKKRKK